MTAPLPKMSTVLVLSEKGSRLSLPSTARAPLILTGTSNATGCCLMAASPGEVVVGAGRCAAPALAVKIAFSLTVGGMAGTLAKKIFSVTPSQTGSPLTSICSASGERANHSTCVPSWKHLSGGTGQIFAERRAAVCGWREPLGKVVEGRGGEGGGNAGRI